MKQVIKCALILSSRCTYTGRASKSSFMMRKDSSISHRPLFTRMISSTSASRFVQTAFISKTIMKLGKSQLRNICKDTLTLARRRIDDISDYKLETIARYYNINVIEKHRALADCITTFQIYEKLNEI